WVGRKFRRRLRLEYYLEHMGWLAALGLATSSMVGLWGSVPRWTVLPHDSRWWPTLECLGLESALGWWRSVDRHSADLRWQSQPRWLEEVSEPTHSQIGWWSDGHYRAQWSPSRKFSGGDHSTNSNSTPAGAESEQGGSS